jgi:hypothetical protein
MALEIGEPLAIRDTIATPSDSQGYRVNGLPESLRIVVYSSSRGWYFSVTMAEPPFKQPKHKPPSPGKIVLARDEVLDRLRQYLRAYLSD